jgi:hypothetical protein
MPPFFVKDASIDAIYTLLGNSNKMEYTSTVLRFIRNHASSSSDDILKIIPTENSARTYDLVFSDSVNRITNSFSSVESEILQYVDNLFTLLSIDDEPYISVQIDSPSFPSVLIALRNLDRNDVRDAVMDILKSTLRNYPAKISYTRPRNRLSA